LRKWQEYDKLDKSQLKIECNDFQLMPLQVQKQGKESPQNLIRRFTQKFRKSGIVLQVRKKQFKKNNPSAIKRKSSALRRIVKKAEYEQMKKFGK